MNYRHAFHAGNFADVFKHIILVLILQHLRLKPAPFRVVDTHAGAGLYDLGGEDAARTGEYVNGIARLDAKRMSKAAEDIAAPFRAMLHDVRAYHRESIYPGSPEIARRHLREQDRLVANDAHGDTFAKLRQTLQRDGRARCVQLDAWTALSANIPPKENRGLVLIDPAFEKADEFAHLASALHAAWKKWPTGHYAIWYPITQAGLAEGFCQTIAGSGITRILRAELRVAAARIPGMNACGMLMINPPWTLPAQLEILLPELTRLLAIGEGAWRCDWLVPERAAQP
ncbi:MAG: 23S rRNA (adenine(2030)-N(6))-methyltransferase RlmJ [Beijerinckiaceae bacterium]